MPKAVLFALVLGVAASAADGAGRASAPPARERYALGLIWKGPAWTPGRTAHGDSVQAAHLANNRRMFAAGRLVAAGPCDGDPELRGIWIWRVDSLAEIPELLAGDPAVQEGRLRVETRRMVAEEGVGDAYREEHERDPGARDSMTTYSLVLMRAGPAYTPDVTPEVAKLLEAHARHAAAMRREGALRLAGALEGPGDVRALLVFAADSARTGRLLAADPAVKSGRFVPQIWSWWTARGIVPGRQGSGRARAPRRGRPAGRDGS